MTSPSASSTTTAQPHDDKTNDDDGHDPRTVRLRALRARRHVLSTNLESLTVERDGLVSDVLDTTTKKHDDDDHDDNCGTAPPISSSPPPRSSPDVRAAIAVELASNRIKAYVQQLQQYNDVKDIAEQLMGMIAEKRGVRIVEVQREFGVGGGD
ncbi:hypothetical protein AAFC00_000026 [Neodothiora populina]|uniref:Swi5-domain-containing protein n=1 Tax=Neodothiora populina TaxID=2781224 RepID=A0ABR3P137_9PEZI